MIIVDGMTVRHCFECNHFCQGFSFDEPHRYGHPKINEVDDITSNFDIPDSCPVKRTEEAKEIENYLKEM